MYAIYVFFPNDEIIGLHQCQKDFREMVAMAENRIFGQILDADSGCVRGGVFSEHNKTHKNKNLTTRCGTRRRSLHDALRHEAATAKREFPFAKIQWFVSGGFRVQIFQKNL